MLCFFVACGQGEAPVDPRVQPPGADLFVDATAETGLDFVHFNGMSGQYYFAETMGAGGALFDYDNDGDLDLYLVQGAMLGEGKDPTTAIFPPAPDEPMTDRLFRNDLTVETNGSALVRRTVRFTDVTAQSGIGDSDYGMGVAAADYDNDGWIDLYVTNFGPNRLLHNQGDGTFRDVTGESGTTERGWSVPALFFDYDHDGWLDLFAGNYVDFAVTTHFSCFSDLVKQNYCGPLSYRPLADRLFHNLGDGTFEDVTARAGLATASGLGGALGAVSGDFDGDGRLDLYVGNDALPNQLWRNQGDGSFTNRALLGGCAVNEEGHAEASMGIVVADHDGDGDEDLFMTHLNGESNTLYVNQGIGLFDDISAEAGLVANSLAVTGFGTVWRDLDQDGFLDLVVLNGAVTVLPELLVQNDPYPLHQKNRLLWGRGSGRFELAPASDSGPFSRSEVSRAALAGDLDNDGDLDLVITNNSGPTRVFLNQAQDQGGEKRWLGLRVVQSSREGSGAGANVRDALGAWVEVVLDDGRVLTDRVRTEGGYAAANDPRLLFPLGSSAAVVEANVTWLDGSRARWTDLPTGTYTNLRKGSGLPLETGPGTP